MRTNTIRNRRKPLVIDNLIETLRKQGCSAMMKSDADPLASFFETICWAELMTTSCSSAEAFYSSLFGWQPQSGLLVERSDYKRMQLDDGSEVCAIYQMDPALKAQRVPPHWSLYVAVESADQIAGQAAKLGGRVIIAPFTMSDLGRLAMLQDPMGALFYIYEPSGPTRIWGGKTPAYRQMQPRRQGLVGWQELITADLAAASLFYGQLFGWRTTPTEAEASSSGFSCASVSDKAGRPLASMLEVPAEWRRIPSHWLPYFIVQDCAKAAAIAAQAGGLVMAPPVPHAHFGEVAVLRDPQTAAFGIMTA